jgi:predicted Ser/Thr protein kinase
MDVDRIFSAEQIKVHPNLPKTIKDYTKAVIKANPENIIEFSYNYFKAKADETEKRYLESVAKEEEAEERAIDQMDM